ncbi:beta strand repeat-containing protein [Sodalinema gerasimenkoae]|uniref:beta strand repeat-containing protein n=1 Tax=Sodalinema gerasimenkoae TaxID=2862348 RepID=UPI00135A2E5F|nr:calcium-binding protein [Sodalinema gerasimenkoae]
MTNLENNDEVMMKSPNPVILSENGEEHLSTQVEEVWGRDGNDTIIGALNSVEPGSTLLGNAGDDYIRSRGIGDRVFGGRGADTIVNDNGQALIYGDLGSDYLLARESRTTLFGGRSFGEATAEEGKNTLVSQGGKNILMGGGGNDYLIGEAGEDTMAGGDGDDTAIGGLRGQSFIFGNKGADYLLTRSTGKGDTLFGGQGNDKLIVDASSTAEAPHLFGGVGDDSLMVAGSDGKVNGAILVGDVNPDGSFGGSDGDEGNNYLFAESGKNHQLFGNSGNDTLSVGVNIGVGVSLFGGRGDDMLMGGTDGSVEGLKAFGDKGNDTLMFTGSDSEFWGDNPFISSGFGDNVIQVTGVKNILRGGNTLQGADSGVDIPESELGNNRIVAIAPEGFEGSTANQLIGGAGNDTLDAGSSGAGDTLIGGPDGGKGNNTYIFGPGQKIVQDTIGVNTYFARDVFDTEVTVRGVDSIAGNGQFLIEGDINQNVTALKTGGVRTGAGNDRIVLENAVGLTDGGSGDDLFQLGAVGATYTNLSGKVVENPEATVLGGAGDDQITINGTDGVGENATVDGGLGNDTIEVTNASATVKGAIFGGEGNDSISFTNLGKTGKIDGGGGADTIIGTGKIAGEIIGGGKDNVFRFNGASLFGGAKITTGAGDENVILTNVAVGSDDGDGVIEIKGGAGNNLLGVSYQTGTSATTFSGSDSARFSIDGVGGDRNILQGGKYGDVIKAGGGGDFLYGGSSAIFATHADKLIQGGSILATQALKIGDGDQLIGGAGKDTFYFGGLAETGAIQGVIGDTGSFASADGITFDGAETAIIGVGTAPSVDANTTIAQVQLGQVPAAGLGFANAAFNVDTITGFQYAQGPDGDRIILQDGMFNVNVGDLAGTITTFQSRADGILFGRIVDETGAGFVAGSLQTVKNGSIQSEGVYRGDGSNGFAESFVLGGLDDENAAGGAGTAALDLINFNNNGRFFFDTRTGGMYLGDGSGASLITVLDGATVPNGGSASDIFSVENIDVASIGGDPGLQLF